MKKETSFQFRKLVQHIAPIMKVYIVTMIAVSRMAQGFMQSAL
ncbi:hypothetical protein KFB76_004045 [Klebsiella pneumoniae]|nr:hypothetical protein [Klebsiella pneumoniae]WCA65763.1 hypothetical protein KFB76_004045 [Klebsiella pneumoniae]